MNAYLNESDEPLDEFEYPDEAVDEDDETDAVPCPECGELVYQDADQCPYCGQYIVPSANVWSGRPAWWIALGLLGIIATITALSVLF